MKLEIKHHAFEAINAIKLLNNLYYNLFIFRNIPN